MDLLARDIFYFRCFKLSLLPLFEVMVSFLLVNPNSFEGIYIYMFSLEIFVNSRDGKRAAFKDIMYISFERIYHCNSFLFRSTINSNYQNLNNFHN